MKIPLTIEETQKGLVNKDFSCIDLVNEYLQRINTFDKEINSFITVTDEIAYKKAKYLDKLLYSNKNIIKQYPLFGVVCAYKDMFLTKGVRTTAASKVLNDYVPQYSATVVKRLENAGCIMIGKTNQDAWAHGSSGENSDFGLTRNPWDKQRVPGGSSSGSAAAMAANFCLISTGTDTSGSIRLPANYCFQYGFKPTYGYVSRYGIIAMASSLDSIGHFARNANDIKKVLEITKGIDNHDSTLSDRSLNNFNHFKSNKKYSIGIAKEYFTESLDNEIKEDILNSLKVFENKGFEIKDISIPSNRYALSVYYIIQPAEVSSNLGRYDGIRYANDRSHFSDEAKRRIMLGTYVLSSGYYDAYYLKAMKVRSKIINEVDNAFNKVDFIISPVSPTPPFKIGEKADDPLKMYLTDIYAGTANIAGIPSLAIPTKLSKKGLPMGFQIMGPRFSDNSICDIANIFEKSVNWKPKVASL